MDELINILDTLAPIVASILVATIFLFFFIFNSKNNQNIYRDRLKLAKLNKKLKLTIELIPYAMSYKNVRSRLSITEWGDIRKQVGKQYGYKCAICGGSGFNQLDISKDENFGHQIECHEIWEYKGNSMILKGITPLCPYCHKAKHIQLAKQMGYIDIVYEHMAKVNNVSIAEVEEYHKLALRVLKWQKSEYKVDLRYLNGKFGLNHKFTKNETEFERKFY